MERSKSVNERKKEKSENKGEKKKKLKCFNCIYWLKVFIR